jgi:HNH endonuclease
MSATYIPAAIRRNVIERSNNCCEYCRLSQIDNFFTFHVDHIISEKHDGETTEDNLCFSCPNCNGYKGSDIAGADPETQLSTFLYHPREQKWNDHFELDNGNIVGKTPGGRLTVKLLRFNEPERVAEREELIDLERYPCGFYGATYKMFD